MAFTPLKTNYKDAIWTGRKKYNQINNEDGTVSFEDVTIYSQKEDSFFGAQDANRMNSTMNDIMRKDSPFFTDNKGAHNALYRGKNLGDSYTSAQQAVVETGEFTDLYIGDYWEISGIKYYIAAFNYFVKEANHIVIVPETLSQTSQMYSSATTRYGYANSPIRQKIIGEISLIFRVAFSNRLLTHSIPLATSVDNNVVTNYANYNEIATLMTEEMITGTPVLKAMRSVTDSDYIANKSYETRILPLFLFNPQLLANDNNWSWNIRDPYNYQCFIGVTPNGTLSYNVANAQNHIRPYFCIV